MASINNFLEFSFGSSTTLGTARALLHSCKHQADNPVWYTSGLVGSEFRSKHTVLMTHIWIVHKRLLKEGPEGLRIQECMFDELWEDTCARLRALGINELSINKYLGEVQSYSFLYCVELDQALTLKSEDELLNDFGGALWRNAYICKEDLDENHVMEFASYLRREQKSMMTIPSSAVHESRIKWGPVPRWLNSKVSFKEKEKAPGHHATDGEWREAMSSGGKTYYWHTVTREAVWDKPAELK